MKKKRKGVQKKKLIDAPFERNIKTAVEEHVSSKNIPSYIHSAYWLMMKQLALQLPIYLSLINKPISTNCRAN